MQGQRNLRPNLHRWLIRSENALFLAEEFGEETWFNWIIGMTLASLSLRNALHHDLDVITTAAPRCFPALATRCSAAHKFTVPFLFLLDYLWAIAHS